VYFCDVPSTNNRVCAPDDASGFVACGGPPVDSIYCGNVVGDGGASGTAEGGKAEGSPPTSRGDGKEPTAGADDESG
jgi:hypothetical protein